MAYHYTQDGLTAYDIRRKHPECPFKIPTGARSMTSAMIDYESVQDGIITWYEKNHLTGWSILKYKLRKWLKIRK